MHDSPGSVVTQLCSGLQLYSAERRIASDMLPSQLSAALVVEALYYLLVGNFDLN